MTIIARGDVISRLKPLLQSDKLPEDGLEWNQAAAGGTSGRRATLTWDELNGVLELQLTEWSGEADSRSLLHLVLESDEDETGFLATVADSVLDGASAPMALVSRFLVEVGEMVLVTA